MVSRNLAVVSCCAVVMVLVAIRPCPGIANAETDGGKAADGSPEGDSAAATLKWLELVDVDLLRKDQKIQDRVLRSLDAKSAEVTMKAMSVIRTASWYDEHVMIAVVRLMEHPSPRVRQEAVDVLNPWVSLPDEVVLQLAKSLREDPCLGTRIAICDALGNQAAVIRAGETALVKASTRDPSASVRVSALVARARLDPENALKLAQSAGKYGKHPDDEVRFSAFTAFGRLIDELGDAHPATRHLLDVCRQGAKDPESVVRAAALLAFAHCREIADKDTLNTLLACLDDEAQSVRGAAAVALGQAGGDDASAVLATLKESRKKEIDPIVQQLLDEAVGTIQKRKMGGLRQK